MTEYEMGPKADAKQAVRPLQDRTTNPRAIPAELRELREDQERFNEANAKVADPRIEAHIAASRAALNFLKERHRYLADETDLDLVAYSRASAVWLLSGRLLGLAEALWVQVEGGIGNEALVTGRSIHEAARILGAVLDRDEEELLRLWLDDEGRSRYVRPRAAREAQARKEAKLFEAVERLGREPSTQGDSTHLNKQLYDALSRAAHNRRSTCLENVWEPGREMTYGPQSSVLHRAYYVGWAGEVTVEVVHAVGDALAAFFRGDFFLAKAQPLIDEIEKAQLEAPLEEEAIQRDAGTIGGDFKGNAEQAKQRPS